MNKAELARKLNMKYTTLCARIQRGIPLEDVILTEVRNKSLGEVYDHLGNRYDTLADMCRVYHINRRTYEKRLESGMSVEEVLTNPINHKSGPIKVTTDHAGNEFKSIKAKCQYYHISYNRYLARTRSGWTEEEALTTPIGHRRIC